MPLTSDLNDQTVVRLIRNISTSKVTSIYRDSNSILIGLKKGTNLNDTELMSAAICSSLYGLNLSKLRDNMEINESELIWSLKS